MKNTLLVILGVVLLLVFLVAAFSLIVEAVGADPRRFGYLLSALFYVGLATLVLHDIRKRVGDL